MTVRNRTTHQQLQESAVKVVAITNSRSLECVQKHDELSTNVKDVQCAHAGVIGEHHSSVMI